MRGDRREGGGAFGIAALVESMAAMLAPSDP